MHVSACTLILLIVTVLSRSSPLLRLSEDPETLETLDQVLTNKIFFTDESVASEARKTSASFYKRKFFEPFPFDLPSVNLSNEDKILFRDPKPRNPYGYIRRPTVPTTELKTVTTQKLTPQEDVILTDLSSLEEIESTTNPTPNSSESFVDSSEASLYSDIESSINPYTVVFHSLFHVPNISSRRRAPCPKNFRRTHHGNCVKPNPKIRRFPLIKQKREEEIN